MDFGRYQFEQKKARTQRSARQPSIKQLRLTHRTDDNDVAMKIELARTFLRRQHEVKFNIHFRGRDRRHFDRGFELVRIIETELREVGRMRNPPSRESRLLAVHFVPIAATSQR